MANIRSINTYLPFTTRQLSGEISAIPHPGDQ